MQRARVGEERHAFLRPRNQQCGKRKLGAQLLRPGRELRLGAPASGDFAEFSSVRREQRGAAIPAVIFSFRIDQHRRPAGICLLDHALDMREPAFAVVGEDHGVELGERALVVRELRRQNLVRGRGLEIDA